MSDNRPDLLSRGERARLIPVVADSSKEVRAASILLATMSNVRPLARVLLDDLGQHVGKRARLEAYAEVAFENTPEVPFARPDGLLILTSGKQPWRALIEAKIGRARLDGEQLASYCELARLNRIDALITISNEFVALPTHHPVKLPKSATKHVSLYHWSWMHVLTQAQLLLHGHGCDAPEQQYLLEEMVRYFSHDSVGISTFDRMNSDWKDLVTKVQSGSPLSKIAPEVENSVAAWHQEQRDLCLLMSRKLGRNTTLKMSRAHARDQIGWLRGDCEDAVRRRSLTCTLEVPDAAAPITVTADIARRTVSCAMKVTAPKDKKQLKSRVNWLMRQLGHVDSEDVFVRAIWPGRAPDTQAQLSDVRESPGQLVVGRASALPNEFEVIMVHDLASKFAGRRTFIEVLEATVPEYYEEVGQHLRAWVPAPPKIIEEDEGDPKHGTVNSIDSDAQPSSSTEVAAALPPLPLVADT